MLSHIEQKRILDCVKPHRAKGGSVASMAYRRHRDDEYTSSAQCTFKHRVDREAASRYPQPSVFRFWVNEAGTYGHRKNILWMGLSTQSEDGEVALDKQGRLKFHYAGADGELYTGRGSKQEQYELATMKMIEGFDVYGDSYDRPNKARMHAYAAMKAAFLVSQAGMF